MAKVLVIEDDQDIRELVEYNLRQEKFAVETGKNGEEGLAKARRTVPDLIVLDLMLPDLDGLEVCRKLKSEPKTKSIPILMLTAKGNEMDRVVGFEVGADDYLTKPFSPRELVLRIRAILKRIRERQMIAKTEPISFGALHVDPDRFQAKVSGMEVKLTALEFKLLHYLISHKGRVATRDMLLDQVWGFEAELTTRTVDTHIKRLREKLAKAGGYIETIRGVGYRFKEEVG